MAKDTKAKTGKKSGFWAGVKTEWGKIAWPEPSSVGRQSVAVVVVSAITALLIVVIDMVVRYGVDALVNLHL